MTSPSGSLRRAARRVVPPQSGARRHLAPGLDLDEFFSRLQLAEVSYVVLRWFDDLPHVDPGEDVDLLVADEDLAFVHSLMASHPTARRTQEFDVYSVSGLPGSDFKASPTTRRASRAASWSEVSGCGTGTVSPARRTTASPWPTTRPTTRATPQG